ncbi:MAG TPA: hypothetical protein DD415_03230 [Clostridiales bacterium]|nr:hypothetical protein [Clostridiales bacterium]
MESNNKHCYGCKYYKPYFTKGYTQFDRCDIGLCTKKKSTVERHEICDKYENMYYRRINRKQAALDALTEHINVLAEIKQILDEEDDEAIKELFFDFKNRKR